MAILPEARKENALLKPDRDLPRREGELVLIEIKRSFSDQMNGLISTDKKTADIVLEMDGSD